MTKKPFKFSMSKNELLCGYIFLPLYIIVLPTLVALIALYIDPNLKNDTLSAIFYLVSFIIVFLMFTKFLKISFSDFIDGRISSIFSIISGFLVYNVLMYLVTILLLFFNVGANPNDEAIIGHINLNPGVMIAVSVLLGPFVEETLFRGVVFGSIRRKNRTAAYIVSYLLFAAYHLWDYFVSGFDSTGAFNWGLLLNMLEYLPGSLALAWCYEKSSSIWSPIFLHMLINTLTISAVLR